MPQIKTGNKQVMVNYHDSRDGESGKYIYGQGGKASRQSDGLTKDQHASHADFHAARADTLEEANGGEPTEDSTRHRKAAAFHASQCK